MSPGIFVQHISIYCEQHHNFQGQLFVSAVWPVEHLAIPKAVDDNMPQIC